MLYSEKMPIFTAKYPAQTITVDGAAYRYVRSGAGRDKTLVLLNGGMDTLEMWMDYVEPLSKKCDVLLFDYLRELRTNQVLVVGIHAAKLQFFSVQYCFGQGIPLIMQLQMEKRSILRQQVEENLIALPDGKSLYGLLGHPFQRALAAIGHGAGKLGAGVQVHPLSWPGVTIKIHYAAVGRGLHRQSGLLGHFPHYAGKGILARFKLSADADPLIVVGVVFLFYTVQHQIAAVFFQVTQGRLQKIHGENSFRQYRIIQRF